MRGIIYFCIALLLFGFVDDYNNNVKRARERKEEVDINYMWIKQRKEGRDEASRMEKKQETIYGKA